MTLAWFQRVTRIDGVARFARWARCARFPRGPAWPSAALLLGMVSPRPALASNVLEVPDHGSEQMSRGGAWVARATDPLAAFYNPAGLSGQRSSVALQGNFGLYNACFTRVRAANDTTADPLAPAGGTYPDVCNEAKFAPNPTLSAVWALGPRVGLGLAFLGPNGTGRVRYPEFVAGANGPEASPQRYMLLSTSALLFRPTLGVGVQVLPGLRVGAGVEWGFGAITVETAALALNQDGLSPRTGDIKTQISATDAFIPAGNVGLLASPLPWMDLALWARASAPFDGGADIKTYANYFEPAVARGNANRVRVGDSTLADCGKGDGSQTCAGGPLGRVTLAMPFEAKVGVRFHRPRGTEGEGSSATDGTERDPLAHDVFDVEVNGTYTNNAALDALRVRFPATPDGLGVIPVVGTPGSVPPVADIPHGLRDVLGLRVGGEFVPVQNRWALRAGAFYETPAVGRSLQNVDMLSGERFGVSVGGTWRWRFGAEGRAETVNKEPNETSGEGGDGTDANDARDAGENAGHRRAHERREERFPALDVHLGLAQIFVGTLSQDSPSDRGLSAIAGTACNGGVPTASGGCPPLADGTTPEKFRTNWPVNLGRVSSSVTLINIGATYRF